MKRRNVSSGSRSSGKIEKQSAATPASRRQSAKILAEVPQKPLDIFVTGGNGVCELGLGPKVTQVKRPRLNKSLDPPLTKVSVGGMHVIGLDAQGRLWTWGQNDSGALGRLTPKTEDDEDLEMNTLESTPGRVEGIPSNIKFVDVGATDNLSIAVTEEGRVWAWGQFIDDSHKEFRPGVEKQTTPYQIDVRGIVKVVGGANHVLFLDKTGKVWSWGISNSNQLGAPIRKSLHTKVFGPFAIPRLRKVRDIAAGDYQSFAINDKGEAFSWGLNNFGQCGIFDEDLIGVDDDHNGLSIERPTKVEDIPEPIQQIASGSHQSLFLTESGKLYSVGEDNSCQLGVPKNSLNKETTVFDSQGQPSYTLVPIHITKGSKSVEKGSEEVETFDLPEIKFVACGSEHNVIIDKNGAAYTWGFGDCYQLGHGKPADEDEPEDEEIPRQLWNTATEDVEFVYAGAGGQYTLLASYKD